MKSSSSVVSFSSSTGMVFFLFTTFGKMRHIFTFHAGSKSCLALWISVLMSFESTLMSSSMFRRIDLVMVFDAILTSRQTREKLQCLYENLMSNNFRKTAVLKKISIVN